MLIPTSNESHLRTQCANKEGESIPSFEAICAKSRAGTPLARISGFRGEFKGIEKFNAERGEISNIASHHRQAVHLGNRRNHGIFV